MLALLNWRAWVAIALAGLLAFTCLTFYRKGRHDVQIQWDAAIATANSEARRMEQSRQDRVDEVARLAAARTARILADAARARGESDGMRDDLRAANEYAKKSRAAAERVAEGATGLLGRCTAQYLGVAEATARADNEARELRAAWPK